MPQFTLTLMRHAKSSWKQANQSDHERPLNNRGHRDAPEMAKRLLDRGSVPQLILCSSAQRTRQTTDHLLGVFDSASTQVSVSDALYLASPLTLLNAVLELAEFPEHIMLVAHNPGIEDLSAHLSCMHHDVMPTAAIRQFTCSSLDQLHIAAEALKQSSRLQGDTDSIALTFSDYPKSCE